MKTYVAKSVGTLYMYKDIIILLRANLSWFLGICVWRGGGGGSTNLPSHEKGQGVFSKAT